MIHDTHFSFIFSCLAHFTRFLIAVSYTTNVSLILIHPLCLHPGIALQDRVADLEAALVQVEAISKAKCNEMAVATAAEIQRVEGTYHWECIRSLNLQLVMIWAFTQQ